ncbi:MAG TPA: discoidin domain-containing protein [Pyrinomonadaceae bacterium]
MKRKYRFRDAVARCVICTLFITPAAGALGQEEADDSVDNESQYAYNMALASGGATAVASSTSGAAQNSGLYTPTALLDGDRKGLNWGNNGGWRCATANAFPDTVEIRFASPKRIHSVDLFTLQDEYLNPVEPTREQTFSSFGVTDYRIEYWDGSAWITAGSRAANNNVWSTITFESVATEKIRVVITGALAGHSRLVEVEAWGRDAFESATGPATSNPGGCDGVKLNPCEMTMNLLAAMKNEPLPYAVMSNGRTWDGHLDWTHSHWDSSRSQNLPLLAHATSLWLSSRRFSQVDEAWWRTFLDCQTGEACGKPTIRYLNKFKGAELFANDTYDPAAIASVLSVRYWAAKHSAQEADPERKEYMIKLLNSARAYLRSTWAMYALAAGQGPAKKALHRNAHDEARRKCQATSTEPSGPQSYWFNGPFLPLAGMRSTTNYHCQDDRAMVFARAIRDEWQSTEGVLLRIRESLYQRLFMDYLEQAQPKDGVTTENAFGLQLDHQRLLKRVIDTGNEADVDFLWGTYLAKIRTSVNYHFLAWSDASGNQIRATVLSTNPNGATSPIYAIKYDHSTRVANVLYPWTNQSRDGLKPERTDIRTGFGKLMRVTRDSRGNIIGEAVNQTDPNEIKVSNVNPPWETSPYHGSIVERVAIPQTGWVYHIIFRDNDKPIRVRQCESPVCNVP